MNNEQRSKLAEQMAIEVIVCDMTELITPAKEARLKATANLKREHQQSLVVKHRMLGALSALEALGYKIAKANAVISLEDIKSGKFEVVQFE